MVEGAFRTGTDRVAAVAQTVPGDVFVNLQGRRNYHASGIDDRSDRSIFKEWDRNGHAQTPHHFAR